jgi:membrane-bound ClpP family serine protease
MFLALLTGLWETLFFYSFIMIVIDKKFPNFSLLKKVGIVALVFLIFHLPNIFTHFSSSEIYLQILLLFAFAYGQALIFNKRRNAYELVLVQAIWGMVLLIHF